MNDYLQKHREAMQTIESVAFEIRAIANSMYRVGLNGENLAELAIE